MLLADMQKKRQLALKKVLDAIDLHGGTTLLSTGITGDDARLARAVVEAGVKMLEPNHPAVALARGYKGVTTMHDAELIRHEIDIDEMIKITKGVRNVVPNDVFITVGIPGGFTELVPVIIDDDVFIRLSQAGADGLHIHKSSIEDLKVVVEKAHKYGLLVDAYIGHPNDLHTFGVPAETPEEVSKVAKEMESIGVDLIGLMTGMSYEGIEAGKIHPVVKERLEALVSSVNVPTLAEGGINLNNYKAFVETGVNIIVVGTAFDDMARNVVKDVAKKFLSR